MIDDNKQSMPFWEVVIAVILGFGIFQWLNEHKSDLGAFPWWALIIVYLVGAVAISQWREWRQQRNHDRKELEFVKSKGFKSWAEYMVINGLDEDTRKSWEKKASEEKAKREKRHVTNRRVD